jgi:hypothetical protein
MVVPNFWLRRALFFLQRKCIVERAGILWPCLGIKAIPSLIRDHPVVKNPSIQGFKTRGLGRTQYSVVAGWDRSGISYFIGEKQDADTPASLTALAERLLS